MVKRGARIFKSIFAGLGDGEYVLPLSGGLDSRAILGGLLSAGMKDQITAVTFGAPGTFDYDIGCYVAKQMGIRCESFNLTQVRLEQDLLEETAKEMGTWAWLFDAFYNRLITKRFSKDAIYWSGFMGDPLAGSHLLPQDSLSWEESISQFIGRNRFAKSVNLASPSFDPVAVLPRSPLLKGSILSYDEQIDFAIRQESYIRHIATVNGYDYRLPFLNIDWVNFILTVPRNYRKNQYLYRQILKNAFPKLFSLPTKTNYGLPLNVPGWRIKLRKGFLRIKNAIGSWFPFCMSHLDPWVNYIDFDEAIRHRKDLKEVVSGNICDLKKRGVVDWMDIEDLLVQHQRRRINCADAITLLVSLEIILKAE